MSHRSSAGGRRSGLCLPPGLSHSQLAPPDNELGERKIEVNVMIHWLDGVEKKKQRENRGQGTSAKK